METRCALKKNWLQSRVTGFQYAHSVGVAKPVAAVAAIDAQYLTGDVRRGVRAQEGHCRAHLAQLPSSPPLDGRYVIGTFTTALAQMSQGKPTGRRKKILVSR